ncbi:MAG: hypothetical protein ACI9JM_000285 [Halioglobus sp.]|jgi:hypothetical protein
MATRQSLADYEGYYVIQKRPVRMKPNNADTWNKIEALEATKADGHMQWDELVAAAKHHKHGTKTAKCPYEFITDCIYSKWLRRVEDK